jgi:peptide/nickel transport system substrate-binding protein
MDTGLNRRHFLQLTAAVPLVGSISTLLGSAIAFAVEGGEIVLGKDAELVRMDVHKDTDTGTSWPIFGLVYDTLVGVDADFNPIPAIAESWTQPSPTTYVFKLRKDAKFSNGRPVDVEDMKGSLERVINPETGSLWKAQIGPIKSVIATGDSEVTVELETPYVPFLIALAGAGASIIPMKELNDGSFDPATTMLGSGPFIVAEHVQDQYWLFGRNPHYWGDGPIVERFRMNIIKDDAARVLLDPHTEAGIGCRRRSCRRRSHTSQPRVRVGGLSRNCCPRHETWPAAPQPELSRSAAGLRVRRNAN